MASAFTLHRIPTSSCQTNINSSLSVTIDTRHYHISIYTHTHTHTSLHLHPYTLHPTPSQLPYRHTSLITILPHPKSSQQPLPNNPYPRTMHLQYAPHLRGSVLSAPLSTPTPLPALLVRTRYYNHTRTSAF